MRKELALSFCALSLGLLVPDMNVYGAAISTSSPRATEIALNVLKAGGTAVDAACAAAFALNVTQPYFTGIGGGGYFMIHHAKGGEPTFLDFRESAPKSVTEKLFLGSDGQPMKSWDERNTGPKPVGIPGFVAGCAEANKRYGKLSWKQLIEPAIRIAKEGFLVSDNFADELKEQWARISIFDMTKTVFGGPDATGIKHNEALRQPVLATTLETLAKEGSPGFYHGALAEGWLKDANAQGVKIIRDDLLDYRVKSRDPVHFTLSDLEGYTVPGPSSAGLMVGAVLRYTDQYYANHGPVPEADSITRYIVFLEASSYFGKLRNEKLADPTVSKISTVRFIGSDAEKRSWEEIDRKVEARLRQVGKGNATGAQEKNPSESVAESHTAHISVMDDAGNAVAMTSSINAIFGSGITLPKYGFILNSELGDFDATVGHPNSPSAGKRPRSNMSPLIFYPKPANSKKEEPPVGVLGAAGGPFIPTAVTLFAENYFIHKMDIKKSAEAPRVHWKEGNAIVVEKSLSADLIEKLKQAGYEVEVTDTIWAILQAVVRRNPQAPWEAVSEPRYDGLAVATTSSVAPPVPTSTPTPQPVMETPKPSPTE